MSSGLILGISRSLSASPGVLSPHPLGSAGWVPSRETQKRDLRGGCTLGECPRAHHPLDVETAGWTEGEVELPCGCHEGSAHLVGNSGAGVAFQPHWGQRASQACKAHLDQPLDASWGQRGAMALIEAALFGLGHFQRRDDAAGAVGHQHLQLLRGWSWAALGGSAASAPSSSLSFMT